MTFLRTPITAFRSIVAGAKHLPNRVLTPLPEEFKSNNGHLNLALIKENWDEISPFFDDKDLEKAQELFLQLCSTRIADIEKPDYFSELKQIATIHSRTKFTTTRQARSVTYNVGHCQLVYRHFYVDRDKLQTQLDNTCVARAKTSSNFEADFNRCEYLFNAERPTNAAELMAKIEKYTHSAIVVGQQVIFPEVLLVIQPNLEFQLSCPGEVLHEKYHFYTDTSNKPKKISCPFTLVI